MVVRLNRLAIAAIAVTTPLVISQQAIAQTADIIAPGYVDTLPEAFDDAYFSHDVDFYDNRGIGEQLDWIFGIGGNDAGFLENEIARDGRAISDLTMDLMFQQAHSTPIIRTVDVPNPFDTSLQNIERIEPLELVPLPPARARITPTPTRPAAPPGAVPALW
jgi:hypothetical protein